MRSADVVIDVPGFYCFCFGIECRGIDARFDISGEWLSVSVKRCQVRVWYLDLILSFDSESRSLKSNFH